MSLQVIASAGHKHQTLPRSNKKMATGRTIPIALLLPCQLVCFFSFYVLPPSPFFLATSSKARVFSWTAKQPQQHHPLRRNVTTIHPWPRLGRSIEAGGPPGGPGPGPRPGAAGGEISRG